MRTYPIVLTESFRFDVIFAAEVANMKFFRLDDSKVLTWLCCKVGCVSSYSSYFHYAPLLIFILVGED